MAQTTITSALLDEERQHIVDIASYARYRIGVTWYRAEINSKAVQSNGAVHVTFYIPTPSPITAPASAFQLCREDGAVLVEIVENVTFIQGMETVLYRFKIGVSVGEEQED